MKKKIIEIIIYTMMLSYPFLMLYESYYMYERSCFISHLSGGLISSGVMIFLICERIWRYR